MTGPSRWRGRGSGRDAIGVVRPSPARDDVRAQVSRLLAERGLAAGALTLSRADVEALVADAMDLALDLAAAEPPPILRRPRRARPRADAGAERGRGHPPRQGEGADRMSVLAAMGASGRFRAWRGAVVMDKRLLVDLAEAHALVGDWSRQALAWHDAGDDRLARVCAADALALERAAGEAARYRRDNPAERRR